MSNLGVTKAVYNYLEVANKCEAQTKEIVQHFKLMYTRDSIRRSLLRLHLEGFVYKIKNLDGIVLWKLNAREYKYNE